MLLSSQVSQFSEATEPLTITSGYQSYDELDNSQIDTEMSFGIIGYGMLTRGQGVRYYSLSLVKQLGKLEYEDLGTWVDKEMITATVNGGMGWMFKTEDGSPAIYPFPKFSSNLTVEILPMYGVIVKETE